MSIPEIPIDEKISLPAVGTWRPSVHVFDKFSANAIRAALAAQRPLLVRGDPGTGKSQLARAAAKVLERRLLSQVINAHTDIQDLWYRYDAVSRLGDAQISGITTKIQGKAEGLEVIKNRLKELLDPRQYLSPGILWWAFDCRSASAQYEMGRYQAYHPDDDAGEGWLRGVVLLIDEIDKADADLPNSLLETLDNGKFTVPWIPKAIGMDARQPRPLVIITTNEDRQLPGAFVRRCMVLDLKLPEDEDKQRRWLVQRGRQHFGRKYDKEVLEEVAKQLYKDRQQARTLGVTPPGQAEYLDILQVLSELAVGKNDQLEKLNLISDFALKKHPGMQQEE
jgi:MoxR-like ATPase